MGKQMDDANKEFKRKMALLKESEITKNLQLEAATEDAIKLCKRFTIELEDYSPVVRCLTIHALMKTYSTHFPRVFEALEKLGV